MDIFEYKIISYHELMMQEGGLQVQKGMNFGVKKSYSIVLVSTAKNPPYNDELFDNGVIEYEGHDAPRSDSYNKKRGRSAKPNDPRIANRER